MGERATRTALFRSSRSQAVRLPKSVAFLEGVRELRIVKAGKRRLILPAECLWDDFFDSPGIDLPEHDEQPAQVRASY